MKDETLRRYLDKQIIYAVCPGCDLSTNMIATHHFYDDFIFEYRCMSCLALVRKDDSLKVVKEKK
jgi:hypothetical protein